MAALVSVSVLGITEFDDQELVNKKLDKVLGQLGKTVKDVITTSDKGVMANARNYCAAKAVKCKVLDIPWKEGAAARPQTNEKAITDSRVVVIIWDQKCPHVRKLIDRAMGLRRRLILVKIPEKKDVNAKSKKSVPVTV